MKGRNEDTDDEGEQSTDGTVGDNETTKDCGRGPKYAKWVFKSYNNGVISRTSPNNLASQKKLSPGESGPSVPYCYRSRNVKLVNVKDKDDIVLEKSKRFIRLQHEGTWIPAGYLSFVGQNDRGQKIVVMRLFDDYEGNLQPVQRPLCQLKGVGLQCLNAEQFTGYHPDVAIDHLQELQDDEFTAGELKYLEEKCFYNQSVTPPKSSKKQHKRRRVSASPPKKAAKTQKSSGQCRCNVCGRNFASAGALGSHKRTHERTPCSLCQEPLTAQQLKQHACGKGGNSDLFEHELRKVQGSAENMASILSKTTSKCASLERTIGNMSTEVQRMDVVKSTMTTLTHSNADLAKALIESTGERLKAQKEASEALLKKQEESAQALLTKQEEMGRDHLQTAKDLTKSHISDLKTSTSNDVILRLASLKGTLSCAESTFPAPETPQKSTPANCSDCTLSRDPVSRLEDLSRLKGVLEDHVYTAKQNELLLLL